MLTNPARGPIDAPNLYGHAPFIDGDFTRPLVRPGPDNDYWDYADYLIRRAREHGLYMAIVAVWGNSLGEDDSHPLVAEPETAYAYGWFLGHRYRDEPHIIWLLGGDTFGPRRDRRT